MSYHFIPTRMTIIIIKNPTENNKCWQGCGEIGILGHYGWVCKCSSHLGKTSMVIPQKLTKELLYDLAVSFGIDQKELKAEFWRDTCMSLFFAALFTIAGK